MRYCLIVLLTLAGCASQQPANVKPASDLEIARLRIDCKKQLEQLAYLEQQSKTRRYYTVDGVEYSEDPNSINKKFHALVKLKTWEIREKCLR